MDAADSEFLPSGHSHNELDQRFSTVAGVISMAPVLEDMEEFAEWIRKEVAPVRGRELHVECLAGTWDFRKWLLPIELHIKGLVATQKEPEANHVWRIVARSDLDALGLTEASVVCQHSDWAALPPEPEDAILLLKRRMHSTKLSQDPLLLLPKAVAAKLNPADLKPAETNELGEATCKEFRKTAQAMGKQPWNLLKAEEFLQKLCTQNESRMLPETPEPPHAIFNYTMAKIGGGCPTPTGYLRRWCARGAAA